MQPHWPPFCSFPCSVLSCPVLGWCTCSSYRPACFSSGSWHTPMPPLPEWAPSLFPVHFQSGTSHHLSFNYLCFVGCCLFPPSNVNFIAQATLCIFLHTLFRRLNQYRACSRYCINTGRGCQMNGAASLSSAKVQWSTEEEMGTAVAVPWSKMC